MYVPVTNQRKKNYGKAAYCKAAIGNQEENVDQFTGYPH
jgi:hypothetical protein